MGNESSRSWGDFKRKRMLEDKEKRLKPPAPETGRPVDEYKRITPSDLKNKIVKELNDDTQ